MANVRFFLFAFVFVMLSSFVLASDFYPYLGGSLFQSNLADTSGTWNSFRDLFDSTVVTAPLTNPRGLILVDDINADGLNEIVVRDGLTVSVYQNNTLGSVASYNLPSGVYVPPIIYDIDGSGQKDIIFAQIGSAANQIRILTMSAGALTNLTSYKSGVSCEDAVLGCTGTNKCLIICTTGGATSYTYASKFNSTGANTAVALRTYAASSARECLPSVPIMPAVQITPGGDTDLVFSSIKRTTGVTKAGNFYITAVNIDDNPPVIDLAILNTDNAFDSPSIYWNCSTDNLSSKISSPLVANINADNNKEFVVAAPTDYTHFRMYAYSSAGTFIRKYPSLTTLEGNFISNVAYGHFFPDDVNKGFCTMAFGSAVRLLCASEYVNDYWWMFDLAPKSAIWSYTSPLYELTFSESFSGISAPVIASTQQRQADNPGTSDNLYEVASPYGIFSMDFSGDANLNFEMGSTVRQSLTIPLDVNKNGHDDLLFLDANDLYLYDDGYTNTQGQIVSYTVNPCIDATWKINTTVGVTVTVDDVDEDHVSARAILYDGDANEQDSRWTANASAGTTYTMSFKANKTIADGELSMFGRDDYNADSSPDTKLLSFRVENEGVEYGDCVTSASFILNESEASNETSAQIVQSGTAKGTNLQNNTATVFFGGMQEWTGLGMGILYIIFLLVGSVMIGMSLIRMKAHGLSVMVIIGLFMSVGLIIGAYLQFIAVGAVIVLFIIAGAILALFVRSSTVGDH